MMFLVVFAIATRPVFAGEAAPSAEETQPLQSGAMAPEGDLRDQEGTEVSLKSLYNSSPLVLVYYRGDWCRFCNQHLRSLKHIEPELAGLGYSLVAVSADKPEILARTQSKEDLPYRLLSDSGMEVAREHASQ